MSWGTILLKHNSLLPRLYSDLCLNINRIMPSHICRGKNTINSCLRRVPINSIYAVCVTCWLSVCVSCVHVQRRGLSRAPGSRVKIKMATSGDGSVSLIQLLGRISQTVPGFSSMAFPSARRRLLQGKHLVSRQHITCDVISFTFIPWPCHRIMPCTYK